MSETASAPMPGDQPLPLATSDPVPGEPTPTDPDDPDGAGTPPPPRAPHDGGGAPEQVEIVAY